MDYSRQAILKTLLYSDMFSFPLAKEELWRYAITAKLLDRDTFEATLKTLVGKSVVSEKGFYALAGKEEYIIHRKKNLPEVQKKLRIAKRAAYYLSYIPTILFIGISGSVAVGKADATDDIDLFIITRKGTLYTTRLWVLALLEVLGLRRKRQDPNPANKVCVNLLLDEQHLLWAKDKQDIFIAHEIAQLKPLFQRKYTFANFLHANQWIQKYLPHIPIKKQTLPGDKWNRQYVSLSLLSYLFTLAPLENLMRIIQTKVMNKNRTNEVVTKTTLAFHPVDYRLKTLHLWQKKLQHFRLIDKQINNNYTGSELHLKYGHKENLSHQTGPR